MITTWKLLVGTAEHCDLRVRDTYASAEHCLIERRVTGSLFVADLGSMNGTWLELAAAVGVRLRDRVVAPKRWPPGWTLWVGHSGLELDQRLWVRAVSR
jgi:hypothetical protein